MIAFRSAGESHSLNWGEHWSAAPQTPTYQDTKRENVLKIIGEIKSGIPWRESVEAAYAKTNPWLYQIVTSPIRAAYFSLYPPAPGACILDIGAGWGQIALPLALHGKVVALEPTPERSDFIRAAAAQENLNLNLCFIQGDFLDIDFESKFDLVCCIGVLEWVPRFREGPPRELQLEFLKKAKKLLKPGGKLVLGIENRFGLKYLLGANDDHIAAPNISVYDMDLSTAKWLQLKGEPLRCFTHTFAELNKLAEEAGFKRKIFNCAFPDYKLPTDIIPADDNVNNALLAGLNVVEHDGSNGQTLQIQAELRSHYKSLAEMRIAQYFAPSYFVDLF